MSIASLLFLLPEKKSNPPFSFPMHFNCTLLEWTKADIGGFSYCRVRVLVVTQTLLGRDGDVRLKKLLRADVLKTPSPSPSPIPSTLFIIYKNLVYKNIKAWNHSKIKIIVIILLVAISISFHGFSQKMTFLQKIKSVTFGSTKS